jgi:hypothetical protein
MANIYKLTANQINASGSSSLYTVPGSTTALIKSLYIANVATGSITVDVIINKNGDSTDYKLIQNTSIPVQTSFQPISDTLVLGSGDSIKISTTSVSSSNTLLSYMEIS